MRLLPENRNRSTTRAPSPPAAQNHGNRRIAEVLSVPVKTVESHMARVLAKAGRVRADLADVAEAIERAEAAPTSPTP